MGKMKHQGESYAEIGLTSATTTLLLFCVYSSVRSIGSSSPEEM